jgi:hypothetical protein
MYQPSIIGPSIALPTYTYLDIIIPWQLWHKLNYFSFFPFFEKKKHLMSKFSKIHVTRLVGGFTREVTKVEPW